MSLPFATVDTLESALRKASASYYNSDEVLMSDQEFDKLKAKLQEQDPNNAFLKEVGAPPAAKHLEKVKHKIPMGSLSNCTKEGDKANPSYEEWYKKSGNQEVILMHKLDGSSVELVYKDGQLVQAITRGDGNTGEDVTQNAKKFKSVPQTTNIKFTGSVRGEAILKLEDFQEHFKDTANPRNAANGTVRRSDGSRAEHITFIAFDCINGKDFQTHREKLEFLTEIGLEVVWFRVLGNAQDVLSIHSEIENTRDSLPFEIDGLVARVNDEKKFVALGERDNRPKGGIAFKFTAQGAVTKLLDVILTCGHTGAIIPTACLAPVEIGGVTVRSALLNNFEEIERLGIAINDQVKVIRSGDVIPKIVGIHQQAEGAMTKGPYGIGFVAVEPLNERKTIPIPITCPACSTTLVKDGAHLFCKNEDCSARQFALLKSWINKRDILHIGEELLHILFDSGKVKEPADFYHLTEDYLAQLKRGAGVVGSNAKRIMEEFNKSKDCTLPEFLGSLGIKFLGRRQVEIMISQGMKTLFDFQKITVVRLEKLEGFSETKAKAVIEGISKMSSRIEKLLAAGIKIYAAPPEEKTPSTKGKLGGKSFILTGAIQKEVDGKRLTRQAMWAIIKENGGIVEEKIKKNIDYLVTADVSSTSSKMKKAEKHGIKIISEEDFFMMVGKP